LVPKPKLQLARGSTPDQVRQALSDLLAIGDEHLPEAFWPAQQRDFARVLMTAMLARIMGLVESISRLTEPRKQSDALILLRSLYEHVVMFVWVAADPTVRAEELSQHSLRHRKTLHHDAAPFGVEDLLGPAELEAARTAAKLKDVQQRARQADEFWTPKIPGFHPHPEREPKAVRTFEGLYVVVYRLASRDAHASLEAFNSTLNRRGNRLEIGRELRDPGDVYWSALAVPITSMALLVAHEGLGWLDNDQVADLNDALGAPDPD
jgi:hypothetical protein